MTTFQPQSTNRLGGVSPEESSTVLIGKYTISVAEFELNDGLWGTTISIDLVPLSITTINKIEVVWREDRNGNHLYYHYLLPFTAIALGGSLDKAGFIYITKGTFLNTEHITLNIQIDLADEPQYPSVAFFKVYSSESASDDWPSYS